MNAWGEPEKIDLGGDSTSTFGQPSVSSDEGTIYFVSDRAGGFGGRDIWMVKTERRQSIRETKGIQRSG